MIWGGIKLVSPEFSNSNALFRWVVVAVSSLILSSCSDSQSNKDENVKSQNKIDREILLKEIDSSCDSGFSIANAFMGTSNVMNAKLEKHHQSFLQNAEAKYMGYIRAYGDCSLVSTPEGMKLCFESDNAYRNARISVLQKQRKLLEFYQSASGFINDMDHKRSLLEASGSSLSIDEKCSQAKEFLTISEGIASSISDEFTFLSEEISREKEILKLSTERVDIAITKLEAM